MAAALQVGVGSNFSCASLNNKSLVDVENGSVSILSMTSLQRNSRAVYNGKQPKSITQVPTQVSSRRWNLRASNSNVRVEASGNNGDEWDTPLAPLVPETLTGEFLVSVLRSRPHMFAAAADRQLEQLVADRDAADLSGQQTGSILYKRIKEVKAQEWRKAVAETIYALVVQKSIDAGLTLIPKIHALSDNNTRHGGILPQDRELEAVHSPEAFEMVREHLAVVALEIVRKHDLGLVLGCQGTSSFLDQLTFTPISKLSVGQVYAASIMYGYFVRRVDQRFQLEKNMGGQMLDDKNSFQELAAKAAVITNLVASEATRERMSDGSTRSAPGSKSSKLRSYVMSFDPEILQQFATIRTKESLSVIEKRAEDLFGKPEIRVASDDTPDDTIEVTFSGLRRLVVEAVAFGTFLWDVETRVDSQYGLTSQ